MPPLSDTRRLGLFGGSFDPVHLGHLLVADAAIEEFQLDRLIIIPAARSPFKPDFSPADGATRVRMLHQAFDGHPKIEINTLELDRGGISYSVDTARAIARQHPDYHLSWLIGADHVGSLPAWRDAAELARLVDFVVIPRPGVAVAPPPPGFRIHTLRGFPIALSSSDIRRRVASGLPLHRLVPGGVEDLIYREKLYHPHYEPPA